MTRKMLPILAAALLLCSPLARAEQRAAKIAITPQSENAAIIIKAPLLPVPPSHRTAYVLNFQVYDPESQQMKGSVMGGAFRILARPKLFADGYLVSDLKPGTYSILGFMRQDWWTLCYHAESLQFTVAPGEVLYLGAFDAEHAAAELGRQVTSSGRGSTRGTPIDFFDNVAPPVFQPINEAALAAAAAMVRTHMPLTTVSPKAVTFSPARFGTGNTLFGDRRCGGYFQAKAKAGSQ